MNYSQFLCKFLCNNDDSDWLALSGLLAGRISRDYHVVTRSATSKNKSKAVSAIPLNAVASQAKICSPGDCCYSLSNQILSKVVSKCEVPKYFLLSSGCWGHQSLCWSAWSPWWVASAVTLLKIMQWWFHRVRSSYHLMRMKTKTLFWEMKLDTFWYLFFRW